MIFHDVINVIREYEKDILFDVEAPSHWYNIAYKDNKLIIQEVDDYQYDGDEWGEIYTKSNVSQIHEIECTLEEYLQFVIHFFYQKIEYIQYEYPSKNYILTKIEIMEAIK